MKIRIRQEVPSDYVQVHQLTKEAFLLMELSSHDEHYLVDRLRKSESFVPELSLVALFNDRIIGHILLTRLTIVDDERKFESLSLAPVSVMPDYQKKGIGAALISEAHLRAKRMGFKSVILVGHPEYYPRFGYRKASDFGIRFSFDAPDEACMAIELVDKGLENVKGLVVYPQEFNL